MVVAMVTGGGGGLGAALSRRLASEGYGVVVADIDAVAAASVSESINRAGRCSTAVQLDVTDSEAVQQALERAAVDGLAFMFNNAGIAVGGEAVSIPLQDWRRVAGVNYEGVLHGTLAALEVMRRQGWGQIVNTASASGLIPQPGNSPYCASKHAVVGLSRALRYEAEPYGVGVSVVCPGRVRTDLTANMRVIGATNEEVMKAIPRARWMDPELAAAKIWRGARRNREYIILPTGVRVLWHLDNLAAPIVAPVWRGMFSRLRATTHKAGEVAPPSRPGRPSTVVHSVHIDRPVHETWEFLTDFDNMPKWARGVERIVEVSTDPVGLGTRVTDIGLGGGMRWREEFSVEEFEPLCRLGLLWSGAYGTARVRYTLHARDGGTTLIGHTFGEYPFPFSVAIAALSGTATSNFRAGLENIKQLVESSLRPGYRGSA